MRTVLIAVLFLAVINKTTAQKVTILTNATIIDGTGTPPQPHMAIVIKGDKIDQITRGKITPPPGATQIDMTGNFIMPAIIDCHSHVGTLKGTTTSGDNYTSNNVK